MIDPVLEDEYLPSRRVPDAAAYFARYVRTSEEARQTLRCERDLAFGPTPDERLDIFPAAPGAPLVVFLHGGYWRAFTKDDHSFVALGLVPLGLSVAVVNYALAPAVSLAEIVAQARRAVAWLRAQPAYAGVPIVVAGHSAGGHLAAMCAVETPLAGVVTISGLHDLRPLIETSVNAGIRLDEASAAVLSPLSYPPAAPLQLYAVAGEFESASFHDQARRLADAWGALGCAADYASAPGDNHFSIVEQLADPHSTLAAVCRRFASA